MAAGVAPVTTLDGRATLEAKPHPYFGQYGREDWLGARTTLQRWFADPVVNVKGDDRGLGNIFTHDHFGPSSIQQHGFYSALVIEPAGKRICPDRGAGTALDPAACGGAEIDAATVADNDNTRRFHVGTGDGRLTAQRVLPLQQRRRRK